MTFFDKEIINELNESLSTDDIKTRDGTGTQKLSYLASFHVIEEANRIFGFGMWSTEIQHIHQVDKTSYEKDPYNAGDKPKKMISISYTCHLKLTVKSGDKSISHEDIGFGNGVAGETAYGIGQCIELATKEAVTDSLKRCLRYYGNKFGLTLYDKDSTSAMAPIEIEKAKIVTEDQLKSLRALYSAREIDDKWVLTAIKAEHYPHHTLELMRYDWFELAYDIASKYKAEVIEAARYDEDIEKVIAMMKESATFPMLKALFQEAWKKTSKHDDNKRKKEATDIYEEIKTKFEDKEK